MKYLGLKYGLNIFLYLLVTFCFLFYKNICKFIILLYQKKKKLLFSIYYYLSELTYQLKTQKFDIAKLNLKALKKKLSEI